VTALLIGVAVFVCVFGGALIGIYLRSALPETHLTAESRDLVKLGIGLIVTMSALTLGFLVASAKGSYDNQRNGILQLSARVVLLDRVLSHYGPETKEARDVLKHTVENALTQLWPSEGSRTGLESMAGEVLLDKIEELTPANDVQRSLQTRSLNMVVELGQAKWLLVAQSGRSIPLPFLVALSFWLSIIFVSFGLSAPRNVVAVTTLFVCALSISLAIFMILELDQPFDGIIQISSAPLRHALTLLGR
jgi:hypothetical protein